MSLRNAVKVAAGAVALAAALGGCAAPATDTGWRTSDHGGFDARSDDDAAFWRRQVERQVFESL